ncbi:ATP-binding cassette domain-containing protein [Kitasatospora phosalacinea]|uniref:ATP-binding cassette domain-containing protein n=1 Tax=Kitasatospora phosalacinea TaxID=2065 RepID=UPI0009E0239D|nr:ATP-binding cassette domain-containing protein [Kitasatospora phosalacinea]
MIELAGVGKVYRGGKRALDGVGLTFGVGLLGLLGPNGAGKSSLLRILATVTRPSTGTLRYRGVDAVAAPDRLRRELGYLPQDFGVYPNLTAREFLAYLAAAKGLTARSARARADELLELLNLTEAVRRPLGGYSGGMLRRVGIAQALLADPRVLVVDEPTAGLDPEERVRLRNLLGELATERAVLLSTHIVSDVESTADTIAVLARGRLLRRGTPQQLVRELEGRVWELTVPAAELPAWQASWLVGRTVRAAAGSVRMRLISPGAGEGPSTAVPVRPDLEDVYLAAVHGGGHGDHGGSGGSGDHGGRGGGRGPEGGRW